MTINKIVSFFSPAKFTLHILAEKIAVYHNDQLRIELPIRAGSLSHPIRQAYAELHPREEDVWALGLPLRYFSMVWFTLPAAAGENMEEAVRYALMRHIPFDLDKAYMDFSSSRRENVYDVMALVVLKEQVQPILDVLRDEGIHLSSIFPSLACRAAGAGEDGAYVSGRGNVAEFLVLDNDRITLHMSETLDQDFGWRDFFLGVRPLLENLPKKPGSYHVWECDLSTSQLGEFLDVAPDRIKPFDHEPVNRSVCRFQINLASASLRKKRRRWLQLQVAGVVFVLAALVALPLAGVLGKRAHLHKLTEEVARIRPQAELVSEQRLEFQEMVDVLELVARQAAEQPPVTDLLQEVTQVLPSNAWLDSFIFARNRIRIQGQAESATAIIEALENSPLLRDVRFESPVTKAGNRDVFQISAEIE